MTHDIIQPRDYQHRDIEALWEPSKVMNIIYGTGLGKTFVALALASLWHKRGRFKHVILVTTTTALQQQFQEYARRRYRFRGEIHEILPIEIGTASTLKAYLQVACSSRAMVVTYQVMIAVEAEIHRLIALGTIRPDDILIVLDEGHRVFNPLIESADEEDVSAEIRQKSSRAAYGFRRAGISQLRLTATPFRTDNQVVVPKEEVRTVRFNIASAMMSGWAPLHFVSRVISVPGQVDEDDSVSVHLPKDLTAAIARIRTEWDTLGQPFGVIRVKPGSTPGWVQRKQQIDEELHRVFADTSFFSIIDRKRQAEFQSLLEQEAKHPPVEELTRMFTAIHKFTEGVDSPSRAFGVHFGVPRSIVVWQQFAGRCLRLRLRTKDEFPPDSSAPPLFPGYDPAWVNRSMILHVVAGLDDPTAASFTHCRHLLQTILYAEAFQEVAFIRDLFRIDDGMGPSRQGFHEEEEGPGPGHFPILDQAAKAQASRLVHLAMEDWNRTRDELDHVTLGTQRQIVQNYLETASEDFLEPPDFQGSDWSKELQAAISRALLESRKHLHGTLKQRIREGQLKGLVPDDTLEEAYESVLDEFKGDTQVDGPSSTHQLLGKQYAYYGEVLRKKVRNKTTATTTPPDEIRQRVLRFRDQHGRYPSLDDTDLVSGEQFAVFDASLEKGKGGAPPMPGGLATLIVEQPDSLTWQERAKEIWEGFSQATPFNSIRVDRLNNPKTWLELQRNIREAAYYPQVLLMFRSLRELGIESPFDGMTIREADQALKLGVQRLAQVFRDGRGPETISQLLQAREAVSDG